MFGLVKPSIAREIDPEVKSEVKRVEMTICVPSVEILEILALVELTRFEAVEVAELIFASVETIFTWLGHVITTTAPSFENASPGVNVNVYLTPC